MKNWFFKRGPAREGAISPEEEGAGEPLCPEALARAFEDCGDFTLREIRLGGASGSLKAALCCLDGMVSGSAVSGGVLRPVTEAERFGGVTDPEEAADLLLEGLAWFYAARKRNSLKHCVRRRNF